MRAARAGCFFALLLLQPATAFAKESILKPARSRPAVRNAAASVALPNLRGGDTKMAMGPLATSAAVLGAANAVGFGISVVTNWHYHLDLIGTGIFAVSAVLVRGAGLVQQLSAGAVSLWAVKLASFLFYRALQVKRDARLEGLLSTTSGAASFWCACARAAPESERPRRHGP